MEVLGRANHLNGRRLLRDRLYSLIEFALKCNLIFSEAVSSPSVPLPQTDPHFPSFQGGAEHLFSEKREGPPLGSVLMVRLAVWPLLVWSLVLCSSAAGKALFGFLDDITVAQGQLSGRFECFDSK